MSGGSPVRYWHRPDALTPIDKVDKVDTLIRFVGSVEFVDFVVMRWGLWL